MALRRAALLALLWAASCVVAQPNRAQTCIPLGGPMLSACQDELKYLNQPANYPLTSTELPDQAKIDAMIAGLPKGLPKKTCCDQIKKFDAAGCACEPTLPQSLKAVGVNSIPQGLQGVVKISATACKFEAFAC